MLAERKWLEGSEAGLQDQEGRPTRGRRYPEPEQKSPGLVDHARFMKEPKLAELLASQIERRVMEDPAGKAPDQPEQTEYRTRDLEYRHELPKVAVTREFPLFPRHSHGNTPQSCVCCTSVVVSYVTSYRYSRRLCQYGGAQHRSGRRRTVSLHKGPRIPSKSIQDVWPSMRCAIRTLLVRETHYYATLAQGQDSDKGDQ